MYQHYHIVEPAVSACLCRNSGFFWCHFLIHTTENTFLLNAKPILWLLFGCSIFCVLFKKRRRIYKNFQNLKTITFLLRLLLAFCFSPLVYFKWSITGLYADCSLRLESICPCIFITYYFTFLKYSTEVWPTRLILQPCQYSSFASEPAPCHL